MAFIFLTILYHVVENVSHFILRSSGCSNQNTIFVVCFCHELLCMQTKVRKKPIHLIRCVLCIRTPLSPHRPNFDLQPQSNRFCNFLKPMISNSVCYHCQPNVFTQDEIMIFFYDVLQPPLYVWLSTLMRRPPIFTTEQKDFFQNKVLQLLSDKNNG